MPALLVCASALALSALRDQTVEVPLSVEHIIANRVALLAELHKKQCIVRDCVRGVARGYATGLYLFGKPAARSPQRTSSNRMTSAGSHTGRCECHYPKTPLTATAITFGARCRYRPVEQSGIPHLQECWQPPITFPRGPRRSSGRSTVPFPFRRTSSYRAG